MKNSRSSGVGIGFQTSSTAVSKIDQFYPVIKKYTPKPLLFIIADNIIIDKPELTCVIRPRNTDETKMANLP